MNGGQAFIITGGNDTLDFIPEPASLSLLVTGLIGAAAVRRRVRPGGDRPDVSSPAPAR